MAEERRTDKTEDPTQKRLDDALERGDVAKSQEVNTWFVIAGATLVLSSFSGSISGGISDADAQPASPMRMQIRIDGPGLLALAQQLEYRRDRRARRAVAAAGARGDRRQHDPAPAGVVGRIAEAEVLQDLAGRRLQAAVRQAGAGELRQGPVQARRARRGHGGGAVAGAPSARRAGHGSIPASILAADHDACRCSCWARWWRCSRWSRPPTTCSSTGSGTSGRRCRCRR